MANIPPTIHINISHTPREMENISVGSSFSPTEVEYRKCLFQYFWDFSHGPTKPSLNPFIVNHHSDTWLDAPPIRQKKQPMHPYKAMDIKNEIYKLCQTEFIFPIEYTS